MRLISITCDERPTMLLRSTLCSTAKKLMHIITSQKQLTSFYTNQQQALPFQEATIKPFFKDAPINQEHNLKQAAHQSFPARHSVTVLGLLFFSRHHRLI